MERTFRDILDLAEIAVGANATLQLCIRSRAQETASRALSLMEHKRVASSLRTLTHQLRIAMPVKSILDTIEVEPSLEQTDLVISTHVWRLVWESESFE